MPLRVIATPEFCGRLQSTFTQYAVQSGFNKVQTTLMASGATASVIDEFRQGRASDYISTAALSRYAKQTEGVQNGYLPLAQFVGQAMGISGNIVLALSSGELRFIPHAQRGMNIVVVAQNGAALTPERAKKVAEVAHNLAIRIHVIWVGETDPNATERMAEARSLAWLAAMTGGAFANLGGTANPCSQVM
jgi:lipoprotein signal peptidase